jgi:hypothetical protein
MTCWWYPIDFIQEPRAAGKQNLATNAEFINRKEVAMQNIMIDIESLGTSSNALILSIGAVEFDETGLGQEFHVHIDPDTCVAAGLVIDPRTVMWWMEQSDAARKALLTGKKIPLLKALVQLKEAFDWKGKKVWCNGASFDFPILDNAYRAMGGEAPWEYWNALDYRTVKKIVPQDVLKASVEQAGTAHDALADAKAQALTLIQLMAWVNRNTDVKGKKRAGT